MAVVGTLVGACMSGDMSLFTSLLTLFGISCGSVGILVEFGAMVLCLELRVLKPSIRRCLWVNVVTLMKTWNDCSR
jgi:hypothetical protein